MCEQERRLHVRREREALLHHSRGLTVRLKGGNQTGLLGSRLLSNTPRGRVADGAFKHPTAGTYVNAEWQARVGQ